MSSGRFSGVKVGNYEKRNGQTLRMASLPPPLPHASFPGVTQVFHRKRNYLDPSHL